MRPLSSEEQRALSTARWLPALGPYTALAERWTVHVDDADLHALIRTSFVDLQADEPSGAPAASDNGCVQLRLTLGRDGAAVLARDDQRIANPREQVAAFAALVWAVNRLVLEGAAQRRHLLHAGVAVGDDGAAVLLPSASGSGKSTLTLELLQRGLGYLSDEAVALDDDGVLHGYPKPVSVDDGAFPLFPHLSPTGDAARIFGAQWQVPASSVSRVAPAGRLHLVVFPSYRPGEPTRLEPLSPGAAVIEAAACSFADPALGHVSAEQVRRLAATVGRTPSYRLVMSELQAAGDLVLTQLDRSRRQG